MGGAGEGPLEHRRTSPRGSRRPSPPGSDRLSIQRPVARRPGSEAYPPGRSPGLDFATLPTPAADPGGAAKPSPEEGRRLADHQQRQPREGARRGAPRPPVSGAPLAAPSLPSCAFKFRPALRLQSPRHSRNHNTNLPEGDGAGPLRTRGGRPAANRPPPPRGSPGPTLRAAAPAPRSCPRSPRGLGLPGLLPSGSQNAPIPLEVREEEFPIQLYQEVPSPLPTRTRGAASRRDHFTLGIKRIKDLSTILGLFYRRHPLLPLPPSPGRGFNLTPSLPTAGGG